MSKIVIANFKMNGSKDFIESWIKDFFAEQESANSIIAVSYTHLTLPTTMWV